MAYCTKEEVKREINIKDTDWDEVFDSLCGEASGFIDGFCGRTFSHASETRYFDPDDPEVLFIDDFITLESLKVDQDGDGEFEKAWEKDKDYLLYPLNKLPRTWIEAIGQGFPTGRKRVRITASWGYSSTPPPAIKRACIMLVSRWFKRKDTAFASVVSTSELGTFEVYRGMDADIELLLSPFRRINIG